MATLNKDVVAVGESLILRVDLYMTGRDDSGASMPDAESVLTDVRFDRDPVGFRVLRTLHSPLRLEESGSGEEVAHYSGRFVLRAESTGRHTIPVLRLRCGSGSVSSMPREVHVYSTPPRLHELAMGIVPLRADVATGLPGRLRRTTGSGFFVRHDAVVTSFHVVFGAREVRLLLPDGRSIKTSRAWMLDPVRDVAILHVDAGRARDAGVLPLKVASTGPLSAGAEDVVSVSFTYGWPMGRQSSTAGVVHTGSVLKPGESVWVSDNEVRRGDSGGPLLDRYGAVLGVVSAGAVRGADEDFLREEICIATDPRPAISMLPELEKPRKLKSIFNDERFRTSPYVEVFELQQRITAGIGRGETLEEMFERLDMAAGSRSSDPGLQFVRGMVYSSVGLRDAAAESYEQALEAFEGFFPASYVLALEYLRRGDYERARVQFEHTSSYRPYAHVGSYGLAKALMGLHRYEEAAARLEAVIDYDPTFAPAVFELGRCTLALGQTVKARLLAVRLRHKNSRWAARLEAVIANEILHPKVLRPLPRATTRTGDHTATGV